MTPAMRALADRAAAAHLTIDRMEIVEHESGDSTQDSTQYEGLVRRQLALLSEDPERQGLLKTPERVAHSMHWLTRGYGLQIEDVIGDAVFDEAHENMVLVRDIEFYSL